MQITQILSIAVLAYVAFVTLAEALIGFIQPDMDIGGRLTTTDANGTTSDRILALAKIDGHLYVSSNHRLQGWYRQALAEPHVLLEAHGAPSPYEAVSIDGEERERVSDVYRMGIILRFIFGFAPSRFLRLDPLRSQRGLGEARF